MPGPLPLVITPTFAASINVSLPVAIKLRDVLARPAEIRISVQSDSYTRDRNWFSSRETGAKFLITIKGKPGFCLAALQNMIGSGQMATTPLTPSQVFAARVADMRLWNLRTPLWDIFEKNDVLSFEITGQSHTVTRTFPIRYSETGPKCSVYITGKPGFAQVAAALVNLNAPLIQRIVTAMFTP